MRTTECLRVTTGDYLPVEWLDKAGQARDLLAELTWGDVNLSDKTKRKFIKMIDLIDEMTDDGSDDPFS